MPDRSHLSQKSVSVPNASSTERTRPPATPGVSAIGPPPARTLRHPDCQSRHLRFKLDDLQCTTAVRPSPHPMSQTSPSRVLHYVRRTEDEGVTTAPISHRPRVFSDEMHCTSYLSFNPLSCTPLIKTWKHLSRPSDIYNENKAS